MKNKYIDNQKESEIINRSQIIIIINRCLYSGSQIKVPSLVQ